jgi:hypothetical protein
MFTFDVLNAFLDWMLAQTIQDPYTNYDKKTYVPTAEFYIKTDIKNAYNSVNRLRLSGLLSGCDKEMFDELYGPQACRYSKKTWDIAKGIVVGARSSRNLFARLVTSVVREFVGTVYKKFGEQIHPLYYVDDMLVPCSRALWDKRDLVVYELKQILRKYNMEINDAKVQYISPENNDFVFVGKTYHYNPVEETPKDCRIQRPRASV